MDDDAKEIKVISRHGESVLVQWIDGKLEMVWPTDLASAPYVYPVDWVEVRK